MLRSSLQVNVSQGPDPKKMKLHQFDDDIPPVQNGVICASKTPLFDGVPSVDMVIMNARNLGMFFDDDVSDLTEIPNHKIPGYLKSALKGKTTTEETLRDAMYTNLIDDHGIAFPKSSFEEVK